MREVDEQAVNALPPERTKKRATSAKRVGAQTVELKRLELERSVWKALHGFVTARPEQYMMECGDCSLTNPQATLLRLMDPERPVPMSALATAAGCHASNITGLVDRLEEQGLVTRRPSMEDRRVKNICLTSRGVEVRGGLCSQIYTPPPELARLDEAELARL